MPGRAASIENGRFRADLYHRLCVLRIDEPPLRARGKDIEILAYHILHKFKTDSARKIRGFMHFNLDFHRPCTADCPCTRILSPILCSVAL